MTYVLRKAAGLLSLIIDSIADIFRANRAEKLLVAAFVVATLRQMGVNGHFVGYDPATSWSWFQPLEVWSGIAMAMLEGIALAYIAKRWRRLSPKGWAEWAYWSILLLGQLSMLVSIVFYVSMYAYAAQRGTTVAQVFTPGANMVWNVSVALVNPLIAILIGIVDDELEAEGEFASEDDEAWLTLLNRIDSIKGMITPEELAKWAGVSEHAASRVIQKAVSLGLIKVK